MGRSKVAITRDLEDTGKEMNRTDTLVKCEIWRQCVNYTMYMMTRLESPVPKPSRFVPNYIHS